jgi:hypothetical protein
MVHDCHMTMDCPVYDRARRVCLVRPGDCELSPADGEVPLLFETPEELTVDPAPEKMAPRDR